MRITGWLFMIIGVGLIIGATTMTTSIHSDMNYIPGVGLQEAKDVYNLGLLQEQMMLLQSGLACFVSGFFAVCIGQLRNDMRRAGTAKYDSGFGLVDTPVVGESSPDSPAAKVAATE